MRYYYCTFSLFALSYLLCNIIYKSPRTLTVVCLRLLCGPALSFSNPQRVYKVASPRPPRKGKGRGKREGEDKREGNGRREREGKARGKRNERVEGREKGNQREDNRKGRGREKGRMQG